MADFEEHPRAAFRNFEEGTQADWSIIASEYADFARKLPDRVMTHLKLLDGDFGGFPIDRLQHCLQTATRAHRDGRPETYVVMALLHDIGDTLGTYDHPAIGAAIIEPFVTPEEHWICRYHNDFQGYYYYHFLGMDRDKREQYRGSPHFAACETFCAQYDQLSFDPEYDAEPLSFFEPMLRRVMARPLQAAVTLAT